MHFNNATIFVHFYLTFLAARVLITTCFNNDNNLFYYYNVRRGRRGGTGRRHSIEVIGGHRPSRYNDLRPPSTLVNIKTTHHVTLPTDESPEHSNNDDNNNNTDSTNYNNNNMSNLKIAYINAQSCRNKVNIIYDTIDDMNLDILCVTETWLNDSTDDAIKPALLPPGYAIKSFPRKERRGGGIAFIYRNALSVTSAGFNILTTFEAASLTVQIRSTTFYILCIYRPPISARNNYKMSSFFTEFRDVIVDVTQKKCPVIITGDFNIHFDSPSSPDTKKLQTILDDHNLTQLILTPTQKSGHILDLIITNKNNNILNSIQVIDKIISDHFLISFDLSTLKPQPVIHHKQSRNLKQLDTTIFSQEVKTKLQCLTSTSTTTENVNSCLRDVLDHLAPTVTRRISARPASPWFSTAIKNAKRETRKAERTWRKSGLTVHRDIYIQRRREANDITEEGKRQFYHDKFKNVTSCKELFQTSDKLLGKEKTSPLPAGSDKQLCESFSFYFKNKIDNIRLHLDSLPSSPITFELFHGLPFTDFELLTDAQVLKYINNSSCKTCDLDPIPTQLLKDCIDVILPYLTSIFNHSLSNGLVPQSFKHAIVKPLLKKPGLDENILKNFRPVSNLNFLSKVLEKVVLDQLISHIYNNNLHEIFQSAYKANHSTETALLKVTSDILDEIDNKNVCILTLLDLSAAFDTIDHKILVKRLETTFGISGTVLMWLESYIKGRFQSVSVGNEKSQQMPLECGVPQGSVLGPVIFTLYTQPLANMLRDKYNMYYHFYADDTQIYICGKIDDIPKLLQTTKECIEDVKIWMTNNKLQLNDDKTEIILIRNPKIVKELPELILNVNDNDIKFNKKVKNLGVTLDTDMTMFFFVSQLCKNLYFQLRKIASIRPYLSTEVTKTLVTSLILSKLDYCNSLLAGLPQDTINRLQLIQNNAARLICRKKKSDHITPLLKDLHWLPVSQRINYKMSVFVYKCINDIAPSYLSDALERYTPARNLRSSMDRTILVQTKRTYKFIGCRSFYHLGPLVWNKLPRDIREAGSIETFKKKLKHHLFCIAYFGD